MMNQMLKGFGVLMLFVLTAVFVSCEKEAEIATPDSVENYVDEVVFHMQRQGNCGRFGCYEFVFPVTINFPDETTTEVEDYMEMREALKAFREANPEADERPELAFPLEVMAEDGTVISVSSRAELHELRMECRREFFENHGPRGHRFRGHGFCFRLIYPVTIIFPDGITEVVDGPWALKYELRDWKRDNPDSEERPALQYPLTVKLEDGTEVTVENAEALQDLKDTCSME